MSIDTIWGGTQTSGSIRPSGGCQTYEATDFLLNSRLVDTSAQLILWQVGPVGDWTFQTRAYDLRPSEPAAPLVRGPRSVAAHGSTHVRYGVGLELHRLSASPASSGDSVGARRVHDDRRGGIVEAVGEEDQRLGGAPEFWSTISRSKWVRDLGTQNYNPALEVSGNIIAID